jgi:iron(III) transport system ATP-binding protein
MHAGTAKTLDIRGLYKTYRLPGGRSVPAVRNFTLRVEPGEFITLLGPSGCGKTTVLRALAGLEDPDEGDILLDDRSIRRLPAHRRRVGLVFQNYALFPHMSVFENVAYSFRIRRTPIAQFRAEVEAALAAVGLDGLAARLPGQLSGGQQQRVALARAFVMRPDLLLFDEPLSNLDAKLRLQVRGELRRLQKRLGTTALYVTHDQDEAMSLSDRIVVMRDGQIEQVGTPEDVYARPASHYVADFVGRINALPGHVVERVAGRATIETLGHRIELAGERCPTEAVLLLVRPEALRIVAETARTMNGVVEELEYRGDQIEYRVRVGPALLIAIESALGLTRRVREGDRVGVELVEHALHVLSDDGSAANLDHASEMARAPTIAAEAAKA